VRRTAYWDLAPEIPGYDDPLQIMHLMFGKLPLLDHSEHSLAVRRPAAHAFALLTEHLDGAREVRRVVADGALTAGAAGAAGRGRTPAGRLVAVDVVPGPCCGHVR
jgi:hypothetical protein